MALPRTSRNFNAFVDGISYFGIAMEAKLPQPKIQTEAHRGSGMDGPVGLDMGVEALSAEITFSEWRPELATKLGKLERFVLRPGQQSATDFTATTIIATMGGLITVTDYGDLKPGANVPFKLNMDVRYYRLEIDGVEMLEIDLVNAVRRIGGVDQLADIRRAMGL